ncbi:MAG: TRAP transporter fused permease subunit [Chloroflexi bacterium]|nr:TRAP transporter fused permease subunit [Chloroflexota bacterium]
MKNLQGLKSTGNWLAIAAFVMVAYQLLYTQTVFWESAIHRIIHLGFSFTVVFLTTITVIAGVKRFLTFLLLLLGIGITVQLILIFPETVGSFTLPPAEAMVAGTLALILCFLLSLWRYGKVFAILTLAGYAYVIFGRGIVPAAIQPPPVSLLRLLSWTAGDIASDWGVYGELVGLMANYVWLFMVFGAFLQAFGGIRFIQHVGALAASKLAGGPAVMSVVTSALVGTVTGVTAANVAITGSFTIPLMKKAGYTKEQAGAIELAASNGGQILPPIMGITAFIMAEFIGMPYIKVAFFAFVPALLYFLTVFLYVQLQAKKAGSTPLVSSISRKEVFLDAPLFLLPFLVLVLLLVQGFSLMYVGFWSIVSVIATGIISSLLRKGARIDWKEAKERLVGGIVAASEMTVLVGLLGAFTAIIEMSGLGYTLGAFALKLSGGNLFALLLLTAVVGLILGTGLPSTAAYVLPATVLAPPIVSLGVPPIAAHLFIFTFAVFSNLTPPIGFGLIVAQRLAGGNYWATAGEALKASFVIFILPFMYIYSPAIILLLDGLSLADIVMQFAIVLTLILSFSCLFSNYSLVKLGLPEKALFILGGAFSLLSIALSSQMQILVVMGAVSCVAGFMLSFRRSKSQPQPA